MIEETRDELLRKIIELEQENNLLREKKKTYNSSINKHMREILNNIPAPLYLKDVEGRYLLINRKFEELAHVTLDEIIGKNDFDIFPQAVAELFQSQDEEVIEKNTPLEFEETIPLPDGVHTYITSKFPLYENEGVISAVGGYCTDITKRMLAESKLRESEGKFRSLVESTSDWIWEIDQAGVYTYVSPRIKDMLGYEQEELIGKTPFDLMPPDEAVRVRKIFEDIVAEKKILKALENVNQHKNGKKVFLETSGIPMLTENGDLLGYRGIDRDISERRQLENEKDQLIDELQVALAEVKTLQGIIPICSHCKKIRDDKGYWNQVDSYISLRTDALFSHSICPECKITHYSNLSAKYKK